MHTGQVRGLLKIGESEREGRPAKTGGGEMTAGERARKNSGRQEETVKRDSGLSAGPEVTPSGLENQNGQQWPVARYNGQDPQPMEPMMVDGDPPPEYRSSQSSSPPSVPMQGSDQSDPPRSCAVTV